MSFTISNLEDERKTKKNFLLRVSSNDKTESKSASTHNGRFVVDLPATGRNIDIISAYVVKSISIPNVFPNIPSYANTLTLIKTTGSATKTAIVTANQYTIDAFITALQSAINSAIAPDSVVVTLNSVNKLNFAFTGDTYAFDYDNSTIRDKIGLTADISAAASSTMQSIVNLIGETAVYVHSRALNQSGLVEANGNFSVVGKINMDKPFGVQCYFESSNDVADYVPFNTTKSLRSIDIVIRNADGEVLELPLNFEVSIMLKVYHA